MMNRPPEWTEDQLRAERDKAVEFFRKERMEEPLDDYLEAFEEYQGHFEDLLEVSVDLTQLADRAIDLLTSPSLVGPFRYLTGPPISVDDLKTVAEVVLSQTRLRSEPEMVRRIVDVIRSTLAILRDFRDVSSPNSAPVARTMNPQGLRIRNLGNLGQYTQ